MTLTSTIESQENRQIPGITCPLILTYNIYEIKDKNPGGGHQTLNIHLPPSHQFRSPPPQTILSVLIQAQQENKPWEFEILAPQEQTNIKIGKEKKHSFFNQVLFRTNFFFPKLHFKVRQFLANCCYIYGIYLSRIKKKKILRIPKTHQVNTVWGWKNTFPRQFF